MWINFNQLLDLPNVTGSSVCVMQWRGVIRVPSLIESIWYLL